MGGAGRAGGGGGVARGRVREVKGERYSSLKVVDMLHKFCRRRGIYCAQQDEP